MNAKVRFYDVAKDIAILAVVLGHSVLIADTFVPHNDIAIALYHTRFTFHMSFFIISGYFMHPKRGFRWRKESHELIVTYAITALAIVVINTTGAFILRTGAERAFKG